MPFSHACFYARTVFFRYLVPGTCFVRVWKPYGSALLLHMHTYNVILVCSQQTQVREVAALMETEMYRMFHPEDEVRPAHGPIQTNNPLKVARMATVLDARTKNAAWASPEAIEE